jgi:hypothetical protein
MNLDTLQTFDRAECAALAARVERRDATRAADRRRAAEAVAVERRKSDRRTESTETKGQ